ncbi:HAD-IA family hydrolase [Celeribacter sp.]|uniref:HAD-IA family hydrolase n=1 Tax=Celeribacter sp. TaxID=1890673 RepID=UPI003A9346B6
MKLVIFDVDGTLVDSQAHIVSSMAAAFAEAGLPCPDRSTLLSIVGLSLPYALAELAPQAEPHTLERMIAAYKDTFSAIRQNVGAQGFPLYAGAEAAVRALGARDDVALAIATGNSRRGLDAMMADWAFSDLFVSAQSADEHPSKPNPSMVAACLADANASAAETIVVGDTTYDMEMARAARCHGLGVLWGYHGRDALMSAGAARVLDDFAELPAALDEIWKG